MNQNQEIIKWADSACLAVLKSAGYEMWLYLFAAIAVGIALHIVLSILYWFDLQSDDHEHLYKLYKHIVLPFVVSIAVAVLLIWVRNDSAYSNLSSNGCNYETFKAQLGVISGLLVFDPGQFLVMGILISFIISVVFILVCFLAKWGYRKYE